MTAFKHYRIVRVDGSVEYRTVKADALPPRWERTGPRPIEVPRLPEAFEDWDEVTGKFVVDMAAKADAEAGLEAIQAAHARKAIEAVMLSAGLAVDGMLAAEAKALGVPLDDLVAQVLAKAEDAVTAEVARRLAKHEGARHA
jgi:hypothetical protein